MADGVAGAAIVTAADPVGVVHSTEHDLASNPLLNMAALIVQENEVKLVHAEPNNVQVR